MNSLVQNISFELSARTRNLIQPTLKQKLIYIHIPKCGGVSLSKALKACYVTINIRDSNLYKLNSEACQKVAQTLEEKPLTVFDPTVIKLRQELLLYGMSQPNVNYISGHFLFSNIAHEAFHDQYQFITMLRDPVKRWISEYFYNRYKSYGNAKTDLDIEAYINSEAGRSSGQVYSRFLCGLTDVEDYSSADIIDSTKKNLHKFSLVGCIEHLDRFLEQFSQKFGRQLKVGQWNRNPKSKSYQKSVITDDMIDHIRELCRSDLEIYNYAVDNLIVGSNSMGK
ncbi:MAG: sulfotransferase family 2 domain-containing protein [Crocosphaera sp.]|nr:sulfotransferase family 2 domain-containing protein [Crocosphaera sp.]